MNTCFVNTFTQVLSAINIANYYGFVEFHA
jgi:hypothetical protein